MERFRDEIVEQVTSQVTEHVKKEITPQLIEISREFDDLKDAVADGLADEYEAGVRDQRTALGLPDLPAEVTGEYPAGRWMGTGCPQPGAPGWRRDPRTGTWWFSSRDCCPKVQKVRHAQKGAVGESP